MRSTPLTWPLRWIPIWNCRKMTFCHDLCYHVALQVQQFLFYYCEFVVVVVGDREGLMPCKKPACNTIILINNYGFYLIFISLLSISMFDHNRNRK